jgi:DNA-binding transcriptional LysR family regulator
MPDALRDRRLDVALPHDYDIAPAVPDSTLDSIPLLDETVFLAMPADPAASGSASASGSGSVPAAGDVDRADDPADAPIAAARDADWIVASPGTLCHTVAMRVCHTAGFTPRVRHHADDFTAVLALVAAGQGVALVPQLGVVAPPSGVRLRPLSIRRRTRIAYRRGAGGHPAVAACAAALRAATDAYLRD